MGIGFLPLFEANGVQAAQMVIAPGGKEGGPDNRHRGADQWLYVAEGTGVAIVEGTRRALRAGAWRNIGGRLLPCRARLGLAGLAGGLRPALGRAGCRALLVLMIQVVGIIAAATQQHN